MNPVNKRKFIKGPKVTVSLRLPQELKDELERIAGLTGRGFSDLVQEGLDQWASINKTSLNRKN